MKSLRILACIVGVIFMTSGTVLAVPSDWTTAQKWTIEDNYIGGSLDKVNDVYEHYDGDVISASGSENKFNIDWMDIYYLDNYLRVDIHTDYVGGTLDTDYGDLFISTDGWNPFGDSPYLEDTIATGEKWEYAFDVSSGNLYNITNAQDSIITSDEAMKAAGVTHDQYRHDQEVLVNSDGLTSIGTGTAGRVGEYYSMVIDVSGIDLDFTALQDSIGFHWAMTCGNDTIEGHVAPEPGTMLLLGSGLLGLFGYRRRFKK